MKKVALFDLDGTLVAAHIWTGLFRHHLKNKVNRFPAVWYLVSHLALTPFWKMKFITTEQYYRSWGKDLAQMLKGINIERAKEIFDWLSDEYLLPTLRKDVFQKLKKHQEKRHLTVLLSGSFQELLEIVANRLNIDFAVGTELETIKNKFSGRIIPPLCFGQGKVEKISKLLAEKNLAIDFKESFAYADGFFDVPVLEMVGHPVAVEPDEKLLKIAKNKGWQII
ncbi:MAG: hypothetical protein AUJ31_01370 [Parcubacteria group bacterium CG1_02_39_15]|nr:MAG: hypothetical protein AUJ31_01370 [Parcubacteria group bacterium CG1_02_39_15]